MLLPIGTFVLSALTLMVLAWYTYDTSLMARITYERWLREGILSTTYSLDMGEKSSREALHRWIGMTDTACSGQSWS